MIAANAPSSDELAKELAAALEWWGMAGVDADFTEEAESWLAAVPPQAIPDGGAPTDERSAVESDGAARNQVTAAAGERPNARQTTPDRQPPANPRTDFFADGKPQTLTEFRDFWLTAPGLDAIGPRGRIPPRGKPEADTLVLVLDPEEADRDRLLSGPQGRFLDRVLAAMNVPPETVYTASALPRHTPMADTQALAQSGLDAVLAHHIALLAPKRVLAFGTGLAPLLGMNVKNPDTDLREFNMSTPIREALMSEGLESLMGLPRLKARYWRRWIEWSSKNR